MSTQPCILVLSNSEIPAGILREMLPRDSFPSVLFAASITSARRILLAREVDLLVIDTPLKKESALGFAQEIAQRNVPGLLMLLGAELYHQQAARLEEAGIPVPAQADLQNDAAAERTSVMHRAAKDLPRPARDDGSAAEDAASADHRQRQAPHAGTARLGRRTRAPLSAKACHGSMLHQNTKQLAISFRN